MDDKYTNYDGSWIESCPHCGKPQKEHQVILGEFNEVRYVHRQPCVEEQYEIKKSAVKKGITSRVIIIFLDVVKYIWDLIPFKEEIKLLLSVFKHVFLSIRAVIYLNKNKPK